MAVRWGAAKGRGMRRSAHAHVLTVISMEIGPAAIWKLLRTKSRSPSPSRSPSAAHAAAGAIDWAKVFLMSRRNCTVMACCVAPSGASGACGLLRQPTFWPEQLAGSRGQYTAPSGTSERSCGHAGIETQPARDRFLGLAQSGGPYKASLVLVGRITIGGM